MSVVHRILLIHFGEPPKTFEWSFCTPAVASRVVVTCDPGGWLVRVGTSLLFVSRVCPR